MELIPRVIKNMPVMSRGVCIREMPSDTSRMQMKVSFIKLRARNLHFKLHSFSLGDMISSKRLLRSQMTYQQFAYYCMKKVTHLGFRIFASEKQKLKVKTTLISYVFDEDVAKELVATIIAHRTNPRAPVLEIGAGPGLVSREFLNQGVCKVAALEANSAFTDNLSKLQNKVGKNRFQYFKWPLLNLSLKYKAKSISSNYYSKYESAVVELLRSSSFKNKVAPSNIVNISTEVPYSLFIIGGKFENVSFIYYVVYNLPDDDVILSRGRVEFFFLIHPRFKAKIDGVSGTSEQRWRYSFIHVFIYLLYDLDVLEQFAAKSFWPPFNSARGKTDKGVDPSKRLLARMQLKKDYNQILPLKHHVPFLTFLQQICKKRKNRIIPCMEMIMPGCGLRMLSEGFTMMDTIDDCSPEDLLRLYKLMLQWPEYTSSPIRSFIMSKVMGGADDMDKYHDDGDSF